MGVVELDVLDGVQHILAGRGGRVGLACAGLPHQGSDKQVQIPHHGCLVLWLQPAGGINVGQRCPHPVRVAGVVHGGIVRKGQLRGQLVGTGTVKAHPAVLPRLLLVGGVADQLAGAGKEQVALAYLPSAAAHLEDALAGYHQMDQVVVTDAGTPCLPRSAPLQAAVEDGQFNVVGVILLKGLLINVWHGSFTSVLSHSAPSIP